MRSDIVFGYSDRIVTLHQGRILADGHAGRDPRARRPGRGGGGHVAGAAVLTTGRALARDALERLSFATSRATSR
jgi:hypothetical protein